MLFQVSEGVVTHAEVGEFKLSGHREADTMMVYFASCLSATKKAIVVRADDTDVFILLLHHQVHMSTGTTIFMDMGLSSKNNRRCYNMSGIATSLGPKVISLPYSSLSYNRFQLIYYIKKQRWRMNECAPSYSC